MGIDEYACRGAMPADHFHDSAISELGKPVTAEFVWRCHAQHADFSQSGDDFGRNIGSAVDSGCVDLLRGKPANLGYRLVGDIALLRLDLRIGEYQWGVEMPKEQALGEPQRLGTGK